MNRERHAVSGAFFVRTCNLRSLHPHWNHDFPQKRATEGISWARSRNTSLSELSVRTSGLRKIRNDPEMDYSDSLPAGAASDVTEHRAGNTDEEGGLPVVARRTNRLNLDKIAECREKSQSAWLHFPHIELIFLLFAFEGAVASQVAAIRENLSIATLILAMVYLVRHSAYRLAGSTPAFKCVYFRAHFAKTTAQLPLAAGSQPYSS